MAYNPYFRYGATSLDLLGIQAPGFPVAHGGRYHTYALSNPEYTTTQRYHGSTRLQWATDGIQSTDRNTIWNFWNTTLDAGYNNMTVIDHRGRMLFDTSWNAWGENWRKERGGIYRVNYNLESPIVWTPPCFACFPSTTNSLVNHNLSGDDATLDDGAMIAYSSDTNVLRKTGYCLRLTATSGSDKGGAASVSWQSGNKYASISIFCQCRIPNLSNILHLVELWDSSLDNVLSIYQSSNDASSNSLVGYIKNSGNAATVTKADASSPSLTDDTWYDVAITFDDINNDIHVYYAASPLSSFTDFLSGETDIENGVISTLSAAYYPPHVKWSTINLLRENISGSMTDDDKAYLQNVFVFDDFITPAEFNTLRRLCWMWNNKTSGSWPQ